MRITIFCVLILGFVMGLSAQSSEHAIVTGNIKQANVALNYATLEEEVQIALTAGTHKLILTKLPEGLIQSSFSVKGTGNGTIQSISYRKNEKTGTGTPQQIKSCRDSLTVLRRQLRQILTDKRVYTDEIDFLKANQEIIGANRPNDLASMRQLAEYHRVRNTEVRRAMLENELREESIVRDSLRLFTNLQKLEGSTSKPTNEVIILFVANSSGSFVFKFKYVVNFAGWEPLYELSYEGDGKPLQLLLKGRIVNNTGVDWKRVNLVLSTVNPALDIRLPVLRKKYIDRSDSKFVKGSYKQIGPASNPDNIEGRILDTNGEPVVGATISLLGNNNKIIAGTIADGGGNFALKKVPYGSWNLKISSVSFKWLEVVDVAAGSKYGITLEEEVNNLDEVVVTGFAFQGRAAGVQVDRDEKDELETLVDKVITLDKSFGQSFSIPVTYDVASGGEPTILELNKQPVTSLLEYYAAPGLQPYVYLAARIPKWSSLNLLPASCNVYMEGNLATTVQIDPNSTVDTFSVPLGVDPAIAIKRELIKDILERKAYASKQRRVLTYTIAIRNSKSDPVTLDVKDQLPISSEKDIEVKLKSATGAKVDTETGFLNWKISLKPGETQKLTYMFEVTYPRGRSINLN